MEPGKGASPEFRHVTVLLRQSVEGLNIRPGKVYVDLTAGGGGHSAAIARRLEDGARLIAVDKDPAAIEAVTEKLSAYPGTQVVRGDFGEFSLLLDKLNIGRVDGILMDLGVSSHQLDTPERGFSYHNDAPLDMRMSQQGSGAGELINSAGQWELERILREYGEEKFSRQIARLLVERRKESPILTTGQLVEIIKEAIPAPARRQGGHPAKRSFQAIRIAVNGELDSLSACMDQAFERLNQGGRLAIITFHSLEDRMVKHRFASYCQGCVCPPDFPVCVCGRAPRAKLAARKPILPDEAEVTENNRSRSAKLRIIEKL